MRGPRATRRNSATCSPKMRSRPESTSSRDLDAERLAEREEGLGAVLHREHERDRTVARRAPEHLGHLRRGAARRALGAEADATCFVSFFTESERRTASLRKSVGSRGPSSSCSLSSSRNGKLTLPRHEHRLAAREHRRVACRSGCRAPCTVTRPVRSSSSKNAILPPPSLKMRSR